MKEVRILIIFLIISNALHAQMTESEKADLKDDAIRKLETFMNYISIIGGRGEIDGKPLYDDETKRIAIKRSLNLFKDDAKMEVSSYNRKHNRIYSIERYLYRLKDSINYDEVNISFRNEALYFNQDNLMKVPDTEVETYVGTITIVQVFEATRSHEGKVAVRYVDESKKNVEVIIKKPEDYIGTRWQVILGDVTVSETKKLG